MYLRLDHIETGGFGEKMQTIITVVRDFIESAMSKLLKLLEQQ